MAKSADADLHSNCHVKAGEGQDRYCVPALLSIGSGERTIRVAPASPTVHARANIDHSVSKLRVLWNSSDRTTVSACFGGDAE